VLELGLHLQHDAILVGLGEDRRHQPLPERVVERVVHGRGRNAEAARGGAVDVDEYLQATVLQIGRHVGELGQLAQAIEDPGHP